MEIRNRGVSLPAGINDPYNVLKIAHRRTAAEAQAEVTRLTAEHDKADTALRSAVDGDVDADLNSLKRVAQRAASALAEAQTQLEVATAWEGAEQKEKDRKRLAELAQELKDTRTRFAELYCEAALALGKLCLLRTEVQRLANTQADHVNSTTYYNPELKTIWDEAAAPIDPLTSLRDAGYGQLMIGWRAQIAIIPLKEPTK